MRRWFKIWIEEWESGSIRVDMDSAERGFWVDMIGLSLKGRVEGFICRDSQGKIGYSTSELARKYGCPLELVESTIAKRLKDGSIKIHENNVIEVCNIWKYQSKLDGKKGAGETDGVIKTNTPTDKESRNIRFAVNSVNRAWGILTGKRKGTEQSAISMLNQAMAIHPTAAEKQWNDLWVENSQQHREASGEKPGRVRKERA